MSTVPCHAKSRAASSPVSSAAGMFLQPVAFWPDHRGEKSLAASRLRFRSQRHDRTGWQRNAGAAGLIGPRSAIRQLTMPRAGRPIKTSSAPYASRAKKPGRWGARGSSWFLGRADTRCRSQPPLYRAQGRHPAIGVHDASGSDLRDAHRMNDLWNGLEYADLCRQNIREKHSAMAIRLKGSAAQVFIDSSPQSEAPARAPCGRGSP